MLDPGQNSLTNGRRVLLGYKPPYGPSAKV